MRILMFVVMLCAVASTGIPISNASKSASPSIAQNRMDLKLELFADRATYRRTDDISLKIMIVTSRVRIKRAGFDGYQVVESVIKSDGTKEVGQKAYDVSGRIVFYDPK